MGLLGSNKVDLWELQVALSNLVAINYDEPQVLSRVKESVIDGRSCKLVGGRHTVCFFPCMRYNYCHVDQSCCTDPNRLPVSLTTLDELMNARVKVIPFFPEPFPARVVFSMPFSADDVCVCVLQDKQILLLGISKKVLS
jgi:hypothetical protein